MKSRAEHAGRIDPASAVLGVKYGTGVLVCCDDRVSGNVIVEHSYQFGSSTINRATRCSANEHANRSCSTASVGDDDPYATLADDNGGPG